MQGNIYEVNDSIHLEAHLTHLQKRLPRLKEMVVQTLWFIPVTPTSKTDRKGALGNYYAVAHYTTINPEFEMVDDWKNLVKQCHYMGFKVITNWVPNHSGGDHYWLTTHPDFYMYDSAGKPTSAYDWTHTRKLNYNNVALQDAMINAMKFWIMETGIDGIKRKYEQ